MKYKIIDQIYRASISDENKRRHLNTRRILTRFRALMISLVRMAFLIIKKQQADKIIFVNERQLFWNGNSFSDAEAETIFHGKKLIFFVILD